MWWWHVFWTLVLKVSIRFMIYFLWFTFWMNVLYIEISAYNFLLQVWNNLTLFLSIFQSEFSIRLRAFKYFQKQGTVLKLCMLTSAVIIRINLNKTVTQDRVKRAEYRVWFQPKMHASHDNNIQSNVLYR